MKKDNRIYRVCLLTLHTLSLHKTFDKASTRKHDDTVELM